MPTESEAIIRIIAIYACILVVTVVAACQPDIASPASRSVKQAGIQLTVGTATSQS
jgi:hypothetical protein